VDDLASVMSGFRNLRRTSSVGGFRSSGEPDEDEAEPDDFVCPVSEEAFSLGSYSRVGISKDSKKVDVNPADLKTAGDEAKLRTVNFKGPDGATQNMQVLATAPENGEAEEEEDACEDHPEGGDGVAAGGSDDGGSGSSDGVDAGGSDDEGGGGSGGVAACATQCDC